MLRVRMRIGTWNLAGRWGEEWAALIRAQDCDVWLLTEVNAKTVLDGLHVHRSAAPMQPWKSWAAVASRSPLRALEDPHPASAAAVVDGVTFVSSILPWKGCGSAAPWVGENHADRTLAAVTALRGPLGEAAKGGGLVWGGDWNHALTGKETAGSMAGRRHIARALAEVGLHVPTATLAHRIAGLMTIDHVAVPLAMGVEGAFRVRAEVAGERLSDHDAYVVVLAG